MATYIFLGHGSFSNRRRPLGIRLRCLSPPGHYVKVCYSDTGQALVLPSAGDNARLSEIAPAWRQLRTRVPGLTTTIQTYNFSSFRRTTDEGEGNHRQGRLEWGRSQSL